MDHRHSDDRDDGDMTPTQENPNVFDDEFAVDGFDMVADGFRPSGDGEEGERHGQDPPVRTISAHYAANPIMTMTPLLSNRASTRKSGSHDNPFISPDDEPRMEFERTPSVISHSSFAPGIARRSISSASSSNFAGTGSPRFGAGGPSHPYGMYPQNTIPRSPSIATTSTLRAPTRESSVRAGPQHPYGMYPQGVAEDDVGDEDDEEPVNTAAGPVGFPGLGQSYQRVRGPDGEEQDIIGVDGHTEQLPPYSRYPEDGPKMPLVPPNLHSRSPIPGSDPGMPLMHQHMTAQPLPRQSMNRAQSMTDQSQLDRHSVIDRGVDTLASLPLIEQVETEDTDSTQKTWTEKTWKEKRRTKFCGVALMWIAVAAVVISFVAAVIGGVVGGYVSGSKAGRDHASVTVATTTLFDASLIASPTMAPPSGTFALSLSTPTNVNAACLTDPGQASAWSCDLVGNPAVAISVGIPPGPKPTNGAFLFYASSDTEICYGSQYQFMETTFSPFLTVQDNDDLSKGPAFYFEQTYDKIVVLPEDTFVVPPDPNSKKAKRQNFELPPGWGHQREVVNPGEKPWFCVWNNTLLEGFIYVTEPIAASYTAATTSLASSTASSNSTSSPSVTAASGSSPTSPPPVTSSAPASTSISLGGSFTMTISNSVTTTTITAPTEVQSHISEKYHYYDDDDDGTTTSTGHKFRFKRPRPRQDVQDMYDSLDMYPYVVKLEERRLAGNTVQPYCQQYQILNNGQYGPTVYQNTNDPIIIQLGEQDPNYGAYQSAGIAGSKRSDRRGIPNACHCEWSSGE